MKKTAKDKGHHLGESYGPPTWFTRHPLSSVCFRGNFGELTFSMALRRAGWIVFLPSSRVVMLKSC